jgi:peptidoglycan/LPS O-acetylase OafA/YrhL
MLIASMFLGTVLYRYDTGQIARRVAGSVFAFVVGGIVVIQYCYHVGAPEATTGTIPSWWTEALTFVSAYLVFGGLFLLRRRSFPRVLVYLGTISYSVYLVHALVLLLPHPTLAGPWSFAILMIATLGGSALTYALIEKPGQMLGRRAIGRYRQRRDRPADAGPASPDRADLPAEMTGERRTVGSKVP